MWKRSAFRGLKMTEIHELSFAKELGGEASIMTRQDRRKLDHRADNKAEF